MSALISLRRHSHCALVVIVVPSCMTKGLGSFLFCAERSGAEVALQLAPVFSALGVPEPPLPGAPPLPVPPPVPALLAWRWVPRRPVVRAVLFELVPPRPPIATLPPEPVTP